MTDLKKQRRLKPRSPLGFAEESLMSSADYRVWVALTRARDSVFRARAFELADCGLSPTETLVLFLIYDARERPTPAELARLMLREHNSVSGLIRRMERRGLLERSRDTKKSNVWRIDLSTKGKEACLEAMKINSLRAAMSDLSEPEKETLVSYLARVTDGGLAWVASKITSI